MAKRKRDYAAEYRRRVELAERRGDSRSVGRGHPRKGEIGTRERRQMERAARILPNTEGGPKNSYMRKELARKIGELCGREVNVEANKKDKNVWLERRRAVDSGEADAFIEQYLELELGSRHEAYNLWFSP